MNINPEIEQRRNSLLKQSKEYEDKISNEVESIKGRAVDIGKYAIVAGGLGILGLILAKFVYNVVTGDKSIVEESKPKIIHLPTENQASIVPIFRPEKEQSLIFKLIMSAIATFILSIAKQKLTQFLEKLYAKQAEKDNQPSS